MKKVLFILIVTCLLVSFLSAADKVKVRQEIQVNDRDPLASNHSHGVPPTEDLFDWQFEWPVGVGTGEAGIETDGTYMYTTQWNGTTFHRYAMDGTYIEEFSVTGCPGAIRDLAYDGQYFYGGAATNTVYEMDFDAQVVISTINAPVAVRAIAYDPVNDGFWANNWSDTITLFDRNGTTLDSFPCGVFQSYYGFAWEDVLPDGPYLWGYSQDGASLNQLVQFDIALGQETGVNFDIGSIFNIGTGIAGGLCISDAFVPGMWTICGTSQNTIIWGVELGDAAPPESPAAPTDFAVIPDAGGALEAIIAWTCPTTQVNGDPLTDLDEMRVYRGEDLIYTDTAPVIGGPGMYVDIAVPAAGSYTYSAVGYNDFGEGIPASGTIWVGEDVPDAVTDLTLTDVSTDDLMAQLDWVNPTTGYHGGYFPGVTGYDIERMDGETFTIGGPVTQWIDDTIVDPGIYWYTVTPFNNSGPGPSTTSAQVGIGVSIIQVGSQEVGDYQIPINLWYMDSMVECIYLQEWLGTDMLINAVSYHANTSSTIPNEYHLEVWMGITAETDLSAGWIDGSQLTEVFSGMHTVPPGDSWIDIPLDTPFEYDYSGNLVVMVIRDDDQYFSTTDLWWCTESGTSFRTRYAYQDLSGGQAFNAMTGPFTSTYNKTIYPDVRFTYSPLEHGDVAGVVTDNVTTNPIEGVEVFVGNWGPATTNALGEYLIEGIVIGMQDVSAFKEGYYDFFGQVEVLTNLVVTYDIGMDPNLFGTLDGTVTDSDTGAPLVGAEINAISDAGYAYDTLTNNDGYYEIPNMVVETYDVFCSFPNYPSEVVEDVLIEEGLTTTVNFEMEGYTYWCDFENNDGGLISNSTAGWQWGIPTNGPASAYSGVKLWGTVINANYPNGSNFTLDTPVPFFIESPLAELEFWHWYYIESSWDGGNVKVSTDGGTSWTVITPLTGYTGTANSANPLYPEPIFTGSGQQYWELAEFDLSGFVGQSILIRWHFGSDGSVQYPGWFIDNVSISGGEIPTQGWLEGTVTEFGTGTPIEGAVVTLEGTGLSATTPADGTYEITGIWPGDYDITCESPLYLPAEELGYTIGEGLNTLDFSLLWSEIAVNVTELVSNLAPDQTEVQTFIITNDGPGELEYNISFEYPAEISVRQVFNTPKAPNSRSTSNITKNINKSDNPVRDESPFVSQPPVELIRDMWDLQFGFDVTAATGAAGNAGAEFDGTYFYSTRWASNLIHKLDIDGNLVEEFSIPGVTGLRDLAYDGTHFYGGSAGNTIYEMDFDTQTLIGTIYSSVGVRAIAYDSDNDAFYVSNWSDPIGLIARDGTTISTFNCGLSGTYGFAYDNLTGGPYLWIYDQGAGASTPQYIHQFDLTTNMLTGISHDTTLEFPDPSGIAGGLFLTTDYVSGIVTIGGLQQGVPDQIFCYELAPYSTWVMVTNNISGTVPGYGGQIIVDVTFDATDLTPGTVETADLLIHNNSNYVATRGDDYVIPVTLNVTGTSPFDPPENVAVTSSGLMTWDPPGGAIFFDDFESYTAGEYLCTQTTNWIPWSGTPGGGDDAYVSDAQANSGVNSVIIEGAASDIIHLMGNLTTGAYEVSHYMYIEPGYGGYYNLLHEFTGDRTRTEWAIEIYFGSDGTGYIHAGGSNAATFTYPPGAWFECSALIDLDNDWAEYWVDGVFIHEWQWSLQSSGGAGMNMLGAIDLFAAAPAGDAVMYYFDDFEHAVSDAEPTDELTGYNAYLDGELQDYTTALQYQFTGLNNGQEYLAGVSAVYDDPGESNIITVPFTYIAQVIPPVNFVATLEDYNDVYLEWEQPAGTGGVLAYHSGYDNNGIGTGAAADWMCAARFTADELVTYYGSNLTSVNIHIRTTDFSYVAIKVWEGGSFGNPGTEVYSADITGSVLIEDWTEYTLTTPVPLVVGNEYWIGYDMSATGDHPASVDAGPAVAGKGDWMFYSGIWQEISIAFALDYNWCIEGVVGDGDGVLANKPVVQKARHMFFNGTPEVLYTHSRTRKIENNRDSRILLGYKIYRNGTEIAEIQDPNILTYDDLALDAGTYEYWATAIYDEGESDPSNTDEVTVNLYAPLNLEVVLQGVNNVFATWDAPGPSAGDLYELIQHDGNPVNGYFQAYDNAYGVVYDLSGYTDVTIEMVDFRHSSWGVYGTWDYSIHIVDWDTFTLLAEVTGLQTTGDDIWEEGITLGSIPESGLVGIFMEPMGNTPTDAYPCIDADDIGPDGLSYFGPLPDYSGFGLSGIGDFLMDLWIMANPVDGFVKAPRFKANYGEGEPRIQTNSNPEFITLNQTILSRELDYYNVYFNGTWLDDVTSTFYLHVNVPAGTHVYNVTAVYDGGWESEFSNDAGAVVDVGGIPLPLVTELNGNYPNPFNPETAINFALKEAGKVRIDIFNIKGQYVKTLVNEHLEAAYHSIVWDGKDDSGVNVSSGVYFYKMDAAKYTSTKKMILMK